jgi:hypothetical protein
MSTRTFTTIRPGRGCAPHQRVGASRPSPLDPETAGHYSLAGADIDYAVQVPTTEAAEAREILTSHDASASAP